MNEKTRRILMTIFGVLICGFSVSMFDFSNMGLDPFQVFAHGVWMHQPLDFGTFYMIINLIMLVAIFFLSRKKIGLGTVINIFLLGYVVDFFSKFWDRIIPNPTIILKILFLLMGIVIMCFASALYFTADMGVSTYDAVALIMSERQSKIKFQFCRIGTDLICTIIGFSLGATIGVGTLVTAFFMGPLIAFFNKTVAIPLRYGKAGKPEEKETE